MPSIGIFPLYMLGMYSNFHSVNLLIIINDAERKHTSFFISKYLELRCGNKIIILNETDICFNCGIKEKNVWKALGMSISIFSSPEL